MEKKWFLLNKKVVSGPFSYDQLQEMMVTGQLNNKSELWANGQEDWLMLEEWKNQKHDEPKKVIKLKPEESWYAEKNDEIIGPFSQDKLLGFLQSAKNLSNVKVWKKGEKSKATVYQYGDLSDALGIVKRSEPRAPIVGDIIISKEGGFEAVSKLTSISAGGLGMQSIDGINEGELISLKIQSPLLPSEINANGQVRYITPNGRIGLMFDNLHSESMASIIEYVKQFTEKPSAKEAA